MRRVVLALLSASLLLAGCAQEPAPSAPPSGDADDARVGPGTHYALARGWAFAVCASPYALYAWGSGIEPGIPGFEAPRSMPLDGRDAAWTYEFTCDAGMGKMRFDIAADGTLLSARDRDDRPIALPASPVAPPERSGEGAEQMKAWDARVLAALDHDALLAELRMYPALSPLLDRADNVSYAVQFSSEDLTGWKIGASRDGKDLIGFMRASDWSFHGGFAE